LDAAIAGSLAGAMGNLSPAASLEQDASSARALLCARQGRKPSAQGRRRCADDLVILWADNVEVAPGIGNRQQQAADAGPTQTPLVVGANDRPRGVLCVGPLEHQIPRLC